MMHVPGPIMDVLIHRGIEDIDELLRPASLRETLEPSTVSGMMDVTRRILQATESGEPIVLFGDYDCDGILGVAILFLTLKKLGSDVRAYLPDREEGYGFSSPAAFRLARAGGGLIVTIDNGMNAHGAIRLAERLGMDVLVVDHHREDEKLKVPLLWSDSLSGASLAWLLAASLLGGVERADQEEILRSLAPFAAIAAIADCVPLTGQQRAVVRLGLAEIPKLRNVGLTKLLAVARVPEGTSPTAQDVAFGIAPRINAAGRMAHPMMALEALFAKTEADAEKHVATLDMLNQKRKQREQEILPCLLEQAVPAQGGLIFYGAEWPKGIAGILAARAAEHFGRPSIVLVNNTTSCGLTGSGRSIEGFDIHHAVKQCAHLLTRFGGHAQAIGLSLKEESLEEFRKAFQSITAGSEVLAGRRKSAEAELNLSSVSRAFWSACREFEPFGVGFPPFVFQVRRARLEMSRTKRFRLCQGPRSIELWSVPKTLTDPDQEDFLVEVSGKGACLLG